MTVFAQGRVELGEVILGSVMDWLSREDKKESSRLELVRAWDRIFWIGPGKRRFYFLRVFRNARWSGLLGSSILFLIRIGGLGWQGGDIHLRVYLKKILIQVFQ